MQDTLKRDAETVVGRLLLHRRPLLFALALPVALVVAALLWGGTSPREALLFRGLRQDSERMVRLALALGADPNADREGDSPLSVAARGRCLPGVVGLLLDRGANIPQHQESALVAAVASEQCPPAALEAIVDSMLRARVDLESCIGGRALAFVAVREKAEILLRKGARPNVACGNDRAPALHGVYQHPEVMEILLARGADVNGRNESGQTVLHVVAERFDKYAPHPEVHVQVARILLARKPDLTVADKTGVTALDAAFEKGDRELAALLVEHGARSRKHASMEAGRSVRAKETEYQDIMSWGHMERRGAPCRLELRAENKAIADDGTGWGIERGTVGILSASCGESGYFHYVVMGMGSPVPKQLNIPATRGTAEVKIPFDQQWSHGIMQFYFSTKPVGDFIDALKTGQARRIAVRNVDVGG
jgi:ankyrin repeat protein